MSTGGAIWFDCDGCLVDSLTGTVHRPGARALLEMIRSQGATVVVWSAGGACHAQRRMDAVGLGPFVDACLPKAERDGEGRWKLPPFQPGFAPRGFVDDQPGELPVHAKAISVPPFIGPDDYDRTFEAIHHTCFELLCGSTCRSPERRGETT